MCAGKKKKGKKEKLVCLCLLSLASNWIFCPEFLPPLCGRKASEGYNSERSRTFYMSPSRLRNKKTNPDWKDQNTCLQLCIHPRQGTSRHITPFSASVKCVGLSCLCWLKEENQPLSPLIQASSRTRGFYSRTLDMLRYTLTIWIGHLENVNNLLPLPWRSFISLFQLLVDKGGVFG